MKKCALILTFALGLSSASLAESLLLETDNKLKPLECVYLVTNEWNTGFTGVIQLTNTSEHDVNEWQLQWILHQNILTNTWNADIQMTELEGGSMLHVASNLEWNEKIEPGKTIEFGFQGDKQDGEIEKASVSGKKCQALQS